MAEGQAARWRARLAEVAGCSVSREEARGRYRALNCRRIWVIVAFLVLAGSLRLAGVAALNTPMLAVIAGWLVAGLGLDRLLRAAREPRTAQDLTTLSFALDIALLTLIYQFMGGGWWIGATYYAIVSVVASATLPSRRAGAVVALAVAAFAGNILLDALGWLPRAAYTGAPSLAGNLPFAILLAGSGTIGLVALVVIERGYVNALRASEEELRTLVESAPIGIARLDGQGRILAANAAITAESGYPVDAILGRRVGEFVDPADLPTLDAALRASPDGGHVTQDYRYRRADGAAGIASATLAPLPLADGSPGAIGIIMDITDRRLAQQRRRQLEEELARAQRMQAIGQLVSGVAHELNNPLAAILAFAEQAPAERAAGHGDAEALQVIAEQARRARSIVRDLLSIVRDPGDRPREVTDAGELVRQTGRTLARRLAAEGPRLELLIADDAPLVRVDRVGLEQVIDNLVTNAAHAAGAAGLVRLLVRRADDACEIVVEDDGPGLAPHVLPRVFEPFFTTKPQGVGTGLGLSVCLGIVQQHAGTIRAENRAAGRGARFTVVLPAAHAAPAPADEGAPTASPAPEAPARRVLLVDDEESIRRALRRYFERRGWLVTEAADAHAALARLAPGEEAVDLILTDLRMPGFSGIELYQWVARERPELLTRVIVCTGDVVAPEMAAFVEQTRCVLLEKPFEMAQLDTLVNELLAAPRAAPARAAC